MEECDDLEEYHAMRDWLEEQCNDNKLRKPLKRKLLILFMNNKTLFLEKPEMLYWRYKFRLRSPNQYYILICFYQDSKISN